MLSYESILKSYYNLSFWSIEFSTDEVLVDEIKLKIINNGNYDSSLTNLTVNNVIGVYDETNKYYTFKNVNCSTRVLDLLQDGIKISEISLGNDICYAFIGDNSSLEKIIIFDNQESIDNCEYISSNDSWYYSCHNEFCGLKSKVISHNQSTTIIFNNFIGDIIINYLVDSENRYDYCIINDSVKLYNTTNEGSEVTVNLKTNTLTIKYLKDSSASVGLDGVIIKSIKGMTLPIE